MELFVTVAFRSAHGQFCEGADLAGEGFESTGNRLLQQSRASPAEQTFALESAVFDAIGIKNEQHQPCGNASDIPTSSIRLRSV